MTRYPEAPMGYEPGDIPFDDPRSDEDDLSEREPEGRPGKKKKNRGEVRFFRMSAAIWSDPNLHLKRFTANGRYLFLSLLFARHSRMSGLFPFQQGLICGDTGLSESELKGAMEELIAAGLVYFAPRGQTVFVPYMMDNAVFSPNNLIGMFQDARQTMTYTRLFEPFAERLKEWAEYFLTRLRKEGSDSAQEGDRAGLKTLSNLIDEIEETVEDARFDWE